MVLAEGFSRLGVPVFLADVKGDLAGLCQPGSRSEKLDQRIAAIGIDDYQPEASPVVFWDIYGEQGHPVRTSVSEMGPNLLARVLELNDTQSGVLDVVFRLADEEMRRARLIDAQQETAQAIDRFPLVEVRR